MKLIGDYHTHTMYSSYPKPSKKHATGSIKENAEVALRKGLKYLAITEHGPKHYIYGVNKKMFPQMREEIDKLNKEFEPKGLKILLGVEANLISLDGTIDVDGEIIEDLDYLIMGYHYGAMPMSIRDAYGLYILQTLAKIGIGKKMAKKYMTEAYINAIRKYPLNMISHPGAKAPIDILRVAEAAAENHVALEISSKHDELSVESIKKIKHLDVNFILNSDAHHPEYVGNIERGLDKAKSAGLELERIINLEV